MITIDLDTETERLLRRLAESLGQEVSALASRAIEDYLERLSGAGDSAEQWAEASVTLTPEVLADESWDEDDSGDGSG
jgi:predicted transcriptional regulator